MTLIAAESATDRALSHFDPSCPTSVFFSLSQRHLGCSPVRCTPPSQRSMPPCSLIQSALPSSNWWPASVIVNSFLGDSMSAGLGPAVSPRAANRLTSRPRAHLPACATQNKYPASCACPQPQPARPVARCGKARQLSRDTLQESAQRRGKKRHLIELLLRDCRQVRGISARKAAMFPWRYCVARASLVCAWETAAPIADR